MSIAAPMLVISLIIYAGLFGLFIYLVILIIRALKKYIRSKDVRAEKSVLKQNLGEVLKDLRTKNKRRKAYMIYSKYDVMKRCISEMNFPDYRYEQLIKMIFAQHVSNENRQLKVQVEYLEEDLSRERGFSARLQEGIGAVLDFLDRHLPEQFRPLVEKARELLPVPEVQQPEREQERGRTWGGMEL